MVPFVLSSHAMLRHSLLRSLLVTGFALSLVATGVACSSDGSASDSQNFIAALCQEYMPCCSKAGRPSDGSQCRAFLGAFAGGSYDAAAGDKCLAEVRAASKQPTFCDDGFSTPSCDEVFGPSNTGTKKPGETCEQDDECAPSTEGKVRCASLYLSSGATIRKCQVTLVGKAGDSPCVGNVKGSTTWWVSSYDATDVPPRGYTCNEKDGIRCDSKSLTCTPIPKIGEACEPYSSDACVAGAYCDRTTKLCTARKAVGDACETFSSEQCVEDAYCDSTTNKCTAALEDGAACTKSEQCKSSSCVNSKCAKSISGDLGLAFLCGGG